MLPSVSDVRDALTLEPLAPGRWLGKSVPSRAGVVFGGQLIGQAIAVAAATVPAKRVASVHTVFARTGRTDAPVELDADPLHDGRSFAGLTVTARQGDRLLARSLLLLDVSEDDVVRHRPEAPATGGPAAVGPGAAHPRPAMLAGWEHRYVEDVDLTDPDAVGPPELAVWSRFEAGGRAAADGPALLAWATVGFLVGTALRPHPGVGLANAHRELSTGVLTHTLTFHDPIAADEWLLLTQRSTVAGGGRAYGTGEVFTEDGRPVASYDQLAMVRRMPTVSSAGSSSSAGASGL
ncbi:acyl-CoA thioesterase [Cryptosporangium minutisporangium]|uniref:Thioesterase family protein n=1 Tax=Cryptosporangium minutisporangium TaxID=113569 RepID=A0ABP6T5R9_9ACTN